MSGVAPEEHCSLTLWVELALADPAADLQLRMVQSKWQRLPGHRNLKGRAGHTATLVGKRIFVLGGRNGNIFYNDVWVFDTETEQWQQLQAHASLSPRAYHTATLVRDSELWVIGGSDKDVMYGDIHMFNTNTLEWASPVAKGPLAGKLRGTHAAVVHPLQPDAILVYGGYGGVDSKWLNDLAVLHTDILQWEALTPKGPAPSARGYHTLTSVGTSMVLFGGKGEHGIVSSDNNLSVYNAAANTWSVPQVRGTPPVQRSNHAATLLGENLIVIHGGRNGTERLSDTCTLKITPAHLDAAGHIQGAWHIIPQDQVPKPRGRKRTETAGGGTLSSGPGGRAAHSLIAKDFALYIFGGYGGQGVTFDDIYVLRKFPELTMLSDVEDPLLRGLARRGGLATRARRFSFPVEEGDREPIEGWRSTKRPRRPAAGTVDYGLEISGRDNLFTTPSFTAPGAPEASEVKKRPPDVEKEDLLKEVKELVSKARSNGEERLTDLAARELEVHRKEVAGLQETVTALKSEIRAKSIAETDLRERSAVLEHSLEVQRRQVLAVNQKLEKLAAENASLKSSAQAAEAEKAERARERADLVSKVCGLEERLAGRNREHSKALQLLGTAESKADGLSRSLEEAKKAQLDVAQERNELKIKMQKLELELQRGNQARESLDREKASLHNQVTEYKNTIERVSGELAATKESTRTLQETFERLAKQLERENSKVDTLERDRDELRRANAALSTEVKQITAAREGAEAGAELVRSELRTARVLLERSEGEVVRLKEAGEQSREHVAALHASLAKNEEDLKALREDNERWRKLVREVEEFEQAQARAFQGHVEKIRCSRQFYPC